MTAPLDETPNPQPVFDVLQVALQEIDGIVGNESTLDEDDTTRIRGILMAALSQQYPADTTDRLRARIHEAVDECQRRHAPYVSRCAKFDHWSAWARQRFEEQGSNYWAMTSEADRLVILSIIAERDEAEARARAQAAAERAELEAATRDLTAACRRAFGKAPMSDHWRDLLARVDAALAPPSGTIGDHP